MKLKTDDFECFLTPKQLEAEYRNYPAKPGNDKAQLFFCFAVSPCWSTGYAHTTKILLPLSSAIHTSRWFTVFPMCTRVSANKDSKRKKKKGKKASATWLGRSLGSTTSRTAEGVCLWTPRSLSFRKKMCWRWGEIMELSDFFFSETPVNLSSSKKSFKKEIKFS